jgi:hypothetical protein
MPAPLLQVFDNECLTVRGTLERIGGAYLVLESLLHPIDGSDFALLGGAFAIALSSFIALECD